MERLNVELRSASLEGNTLSGLAHAYGQKARINGRMETLKPGAFTEALKSSDAVALFNHDPNGILGRQSSGTLRLEDSDEGLRFSVDLPDTQVGRDVRTLVERGDIVGASFGFVPGKVTFSRDPATGLEVRTHVSVKELMDVSPVAMPAFAGTSLQLRSADGSTESLKSQLVRARARVLAAASGKRK